MQTTSEPIESKCPKCGRMGRQDIIHPHKDNPNYAYLRMVHGTNDLCYVGRVRKPGEGLGLLNHPQTVEEYEKAMTHVAKDIRGLLKDYSGSDIGSVKRITRILDEILTNYGY